MASPQGRAKQLSDSQSPLTRFCAMQHTMISTYSRPKTFPKLCQIRLALLLSRVSKQHIEVIYLQYYTYGNTTILHCSGCCRNPPGISTYITRESLTRCKKRRLRIILRIFEQSCQPYSYHLTRSTRCTALTNAFNYFTNQATRSRFMEMSNG